MNAIDIERCTADLADLSHRLAIETDMWADYVRKPWDHGLNEARIKMALHNLNQAERHLRRLLAKSEPTILGDAA